MTQRRLSKIAANAFLILMMVFLPSAVADSALRDAAFVKAARESSVVKVFERLTESRRLSEEDAARYANVFAFQENGDIAKAVAEASKIHDRRLMGHVLAQRYLSADYTASYAELSDWMKNYADHPMADKIYSLAQKKKSGNARLTAPTETKGIPAFQDFDVGQLAQPYLDNAKVHPRARDVIKSIDGYLAKDKASMALRYLENSKTLFTDTAYDAVQAEIAQSYFYNGKFDRALEYAQKSLKRSGDELPLAGWVAGLAAWKKGHYGPAAKSFETAAKSDRASAWMTSAAAHWAARSYARLHETSKANRWLKKSAEYPRTFYGIISLRALGMDPSRFNWDVPSLSDRHIRALAATKSGKRALALVDAGQPLLAEAELRRMHPGKDTVLTEAMVALSQAHGMPALSLRMGSAFRDNDDRLFDAALYPDVPWEPTKGFDVDRALVLAYIRQESKFETAANNRSSGATGLMQLMPATAKHIAKLSGDETADIQLTDPQVNIELGQKYLAHLLKDVSVDKNLFKLAVAYNAGPGKLARWEKQVDYDNDPLLFIESIPVMETRVFVERVMTNFWIYRLKYDQKTDSLDRVALGEWPVYLAQDIRRGPRFADAAARLFTR